MLNQDQIAREIEAALSAGAVERAAQLADRAVHEGLRRPVLVRRVAEALERMGAGPAGAELLRRALVASPKDPMLLIGFGGRLLQLGRTQDAVAQFEAAAAADPSVAEAPFALGKALAQLGEFDRARAAFERALTITPQDAQVRAVLATLLARAGENDAARREADRSLDMDPGNAAALAALGLIQLSDRDFTAAEATLRAALRTQTLGPFEQATVTTLLGDALDGQKKATAAFVMYRTANDAARRLYAPVYEAPSRAYLQHLARLATVFGTAEATDWAPAPADAKDGPGLRGHVFLVGFPRSGTTLLEQVLAAHPDVVTLEEKPTLARADSAFLDDAQGVARLAALDAAGAEPFRNDYWRIVREAGVDPSGKVFVDKLPLNAPRLPLIAKLFPGAKVLFARRDPRDVVLSCFRRSFAPNVATYAMLTLEGAAELYAAVMRLADLYRRILPLPTHEVRYETFVQDFEGEARRVCGFLDLAWDEAMKGFATRDVGRLINTPSAAQVRRGLYREPEAIWRRYREPLKAVEPVLGPWIERFDYPPA